jgi:hypothetical protein
VTWLPLNKATVLIAHDEQKARERLERAITKAWQTPFGRLPQPTQEPNIPLRIQVIPPVGQRVLGRQWLDQPVLHWESSEIECLCTLWAPIGVPQSPGTQCRARIEVWEEDLVRLWGGNSAGSRPLCVPTRIPGHHLATTACPPEPPTSDHP